MNKEIKRIKKKTNISGMFCKSQNFKFTCAFEITIEWLKGVLKITKLLTFQNDFTLSIFCLELMTLFKSWKLVSVLVKISRENKLKLTFCL